MSEHIPPGQPESGQIVSEPFVSEPIVSEPKQPRWDPLPWLCGLGFLILAGAIFYLWQSFTELSDQARDAQADRQQLVDMQARVNRLEQRPTPDMSKITARLDALDGRVANDAQLASRLDTVSSRIEALAGRDQSTSDAIKQQNEALANRVAALEASAGNTQAASQRLDRIARLQQASMQLASGQPLGDLPGAPPPLARFAQTAPPTEAQLRALFLRTEPAALAAKSQDDTNASFADRVLQRAQGLLTIRRGDDVVVGNPVAITLSHAQAALDGGDLAGAVNTVETMTGPPAQAMAPWVEAAKGLLDARSALTQMIDKT